MTPLIIETTLDVTPEYRRQLLLIAEHRVAESKLLENQKQRIIGRIKKARENLPNTQSAERSLAKVNSQEKKQQHELRAIHLARGFLKGTPYRKIEVATRANNSPVENSTVRRSLLGWLANLAAPEEVTDWVNAQ